MKTVIIAEAGVNHNGSLTRALEMVDVATEVGADVIKFQTYDVGHHVKRDLGKAPYQEQNDPTGENQFEMLKRLSFGKKELAALVDRCGKRGIEFLSSPFDIPSVQLLSSLGVVRLKVPSGELTNDPYLLHVAKTKLPLVISTGMSSLDEIRHALDIVCFGYLNPASEPRNNAAAGYSKQPKAGDLLQERVTLLHCTSSYPAYAEEVHLLAMDTLWENFHLPVGYSDHTEGIAIAMAAVARGAVMIEKHLTLDRTLPGPDHKSSLDPKQFAQMVHGIREVEHGLGRPEKMPGQREMENRPIVRKSLIAQQAIAAGEAFTKENLAVKRPGSGVSPSRYWDYLGKKANRAYQADELIDEI